jgi:hypothetical protein
MAALETGLALTWLGTNSGTPTLERNVSCTLVRLPGVVHVVDCGEGSSRQLQAAFGDGPEGAEAMAEVDRWAGSLAACGSVPYAVERRPRRRRGHR